MAINFEAANMAGYNNPKVHMLRVSVDATGNKVIEAPSLATLENIVKSGFLPVLYVTFASGSTAIAPLTAIDAEGNYLFSCAFSVTVSPTSPAMFTLVYFKSTGITSASLVNL